MCATTMRRGLRFTYDDRLKSIMGYAFHAKVNKTNSEGNACRVHEL